MSLVVLQYFCVILVEALFEVGNPNMIQNTDKFNYETYLNHAIYNILIKSKEDS
jgi:hypothetical protein